MNVCVIDIGSNTVKASVYRISAKCERSEIAFKGRKDRLITHINEDKNLSKEGMEKLEQSLTMLINFANEHQCDKIYAFATASLRGIANSEDVIKYVMDKFSLHIDVLSEEEEALCSLRGILCDHECSQVESGIMIDMGGGSTEVVLFENGKMPVIKSLGFGCLSLTENGIIRKDALDIINSQLKKCAYAKNSRKPLFLVGGTARAVLRVVNGEQNDCKLKSDGSDFGYIIKKMNDAEFLNKINKIIPSRINTIFSGAMAYNELVKYINPSSITVSDSGVRDGYLERILP